MSSTTSSRSTAAGSGASKSTQAASSATYGTLATFGRPASASDKTAVLAAFHGYLSAIGDGNWTEACRLLSSPVKRALAKLLAHVHGMPTHGCAAALGAVLGRTSPSLRKRQESTGVLAVRTEGDQAFVLYRSRQFPHATLSMLRESGHWTAGVVAAAQGVP